MYTASVCRAIARAASGSVSSTTFCSGARTRPGPRISRASAVCSGVIEVRMRAVGLVARELEHLRAECGEHALRRLRWVPARRSSDASIASRYSRIAVRGGPYDPRNSPSTSGWWLTPSPSRNRLGNASLRLCHPLFIAIGVRA